MEKCNVLGVQLSRVTMEQALERVQNVPGGGALAVYTPNPEIVMLARRDPVFQGVLNAADLLLADGIGVVMASAILKRPLPERVAGFDFVCRLLETGKTFYLLGAKPGVAERAAQSLRSKGVKVVGVHHGYFEDDGPVIADINEKKPQVLLVALGAPKQELWIHRNRGDLAADICVGCGGALDVLAGDVKRAPAVFQRFGLEWLYRGITQPSRLARFGAIPVFLWKVFRER